MKFDKQQKGLFTFYREQQLQEDQIAEKRRLARQLSERPSPTKAPPRSHQQIVHRQKSLSPADAQSSQTPPPPPYRRYGEAVVVFNRKASEQSVQCKASKQELGSYLEHKNLEFNHPEPQKQQLIPVRKSTHRLRQKFRLALSKERNSTKLPSISKLQQEPLRFGNGSRSRANGSLLRANGSQLLREIRSRMFEQEGAKHSVSYFQISGLKQQESGMRMTQLSLQQRRLLDVLHRYRR